MTTVETLVEEFTSRMAALLESQTLERARVAVESAFGGARPGLPAKLPGAVSRGKARRKPPRQLCPVPGCKNPPAPVFGMVCAEHKGVAKAKIKKYREARRAAKLGAKTSKSASPKAKKKRASVARKPKKGPSSAIKRAVPKNSIGGQKSSKKARPKAAPTATQPSAAPPAMAAATA